MIPLRFKAASLPAVRIHHATRSAGPTPAGVSKRIGLVRGAAAHAIVTATACVLAVLLFAAYHMRRQGGPGTWPEMIRRVGPPAASSEAAVHSAQTMSDAEIEQACMRYRVPDPAQYRADHAALAQALVHALRTGGGTGRLMQNITFQQQMATLTLEERERIAMEVGTAVYHGPEEAMLVNAAEEVSCKMGSRAALQAYYLCASSLAVCALIWNDHACLC